MLSLEDCRSIIRPQPATHKSNHSKVYVSISEPHTPAMDRTDTHPPAIPSSTSHQWTPTASSLEKDEKQDDGALYQEWMRTPHSDGIGANRSNLVQLLGYAADPSSRYYEYGPCYYQGVVPSAYMYAIVPPISVGSQDWKYGDATTFIPPPPTTPTTSINPTTPAKRAATSALLMSPMSVSDTACTSSDSAAIAIKDSSTTSSSAKRRKRVKPEFKIVHNYHDNADMTFRTFMESHPGHKPAREFKYHMSFPRALHAMLDFVSKSGQTDIVSWSSHGRAFRIQKPEEFTKFLIPKYYQMKNYASFLRQLHIYGFKCISRDGPDKGAYYHELFLRGKVDLSRVMGRVKVKGTRHKGANNPDDEPDFFSYPALHVRVDEEAEEAKLFSKEEATSMSIYPIPAPVSLDSTERTGQGTFDDEDDAIDSLLEEAFFGSDFDPSGNNIEFSTKPASLVEPQNPMISSAAKGPADPGFAPPLPDDISDIFLPDTDHLY